MTRNARTTTTAANNPPTAPGPPMDRREFLRICSLLGLSAPVAGCARPATGSSRDEHVLIVGAGAAGLIAAAELHRAGVSFELVEASDRIGGRLRTDWWFADFPINLGAEWIHDVRRRRGPVVLNELSGRDDAASLAAPYRPTTGATWDGETYTPDDEIASAWHTDWRFKDITWFEFFETLISDGVRQKIRLETPIATVDHSGTRVTCTTSVGAPIHADRVILTVPLRPLMDGDLRFIPELPERKRDAFKHVVMPAGLKVFLEFSTRFYPDVIALTSSHDDREGEAIFYNAALHRETDRHVLGFFCHGAPGDPFTAIQREDHLVRALLAQLDEMFDGGATPAYLQHIVQDWSREPYIRGTYSDYFGGARAARVLAEPLDDRVFFAGEAYAGDDWSYVHVAALSGRDRAREIVTLATT